MRSNAPLLFALLALSAPAAAQELPHAFVGAKVLPISGAPIDDGTVVVQFGRIRAIGARGAVEVPAGAKVIDVKGKVLMPGLVDTHSHVGGGWGADSSAPIQPDVRMLDAVNCRDAGLQRAQAGGITTLNVMSGSGHLMSGQTIYLKNKDVRTIEEQCTPSRAKWPALPAWSRWMCVRNSADRSRGARLSAASCSTSPS
jgi:imidazolonepropionase-like amidohydrolase